MPKERKKKIPIVRQSVVNLNRLFVFYFLYFLEKEKITKQKTLQTIQDNDKVPYMHFVHILHQ